MRHLHLIPRFFYALALVVTLASCQNSSDPVVPTQTVIQNNVQGDTWKITLYIDSGKDETSHFTGYSFTFATNGTITATNGSSSQTGTWSVNDSNSNDDSIDNLDFNISFSLGNDFDSLSEDWNFVSQSSTRIELIHVSGGNGGTDYLTFEKI